MRIAFTGSHSTGKSCLVNILKKHLDLPIIPEVARIVIEEIGKIPDNMTMEEKLEFEWKIIEKQIEFEDKYKDGFISDRSVIDILGYVYMLGLHIYYPKEVEEMETIIYNRVSNYDYIFYIPVVKEIPLVKDGVRYTCEYCRNLLDRFYFDLLYDFYDDGIVKVIYVKPINLQERVKFVLEHIGYCELD